MKNQFDSSENSRGDCGASNCVIPLAINLAVVLGSRIVFNNIKETFKAKYPYFLRHIPFGLFKSPIILSTPVESRLAPEEELLKAPVITIYFIFFKLYYSI